MVHAFEKPIVTQPAWAAGGVNADLSGWAGRLGDMGALLSLVAGLQQRITSLDREHRRLSKDYQLLDEQVRLVSQVQRELLPGPFAFDGVELHTLYRPLERVSGDIYDVTRLDEAHLGICIADASGHGMPAALMTVLLKRCFCGRELHNGSSRLLDPVEVLRRVNLELLETNLKQCQFVTGLYGVYDRHAGTLTFARGGLPYPILVRQSGAATQLITKGPIIGAFSDTDFESMTIRLDPGDHVLVYTDGLEALLMECSAGPRYDSIVQTPWFAGLGGRPISDSLDDIARRLDAVDSYEWPADDVSMMSLSARQ